jgi:uncharacterized protein (DUF305 family)
MRRSFLRVIAGGLTLSVVVACASSTRAPERDAVQPGGQAVLTPAAQAAADGGIPPYTAADVHFMSGMIRHHAQAVLMAGWAPSHDADVAVRGLCERIVVAQRDEIAFMQRWLRERGETVPHGDTSHAHLTPGMDHSTLMPGMLTGEELAQLDGTRGGDFDRLFLKFMIYHHEGAITMVEQLLGSHGAAQDDDIFLFASDVNADQGAEIERMDRMLEALSSGR